MLQQFMAGGVLAVLLAVGAAAAPASASTPADGGPAAVEDVISSDAVVELDPATGAIVSITPASGAEARTTPTGACTALSVCLVSASGGANYGFINAGAVNGSWTNRGSYQAGQWQVQLKWLWNGSTVTGPVLGAGTSANWGGSAVTVTNVRIF